MEEQEKKKKSFWKDKKNTAIVILSILLLLALGSTSSEPTPNGETTRLKSELNVISSEKEELAVQLKSAENRVEYLSAELENKVEPDKLQEYENQIQALNLEKTNLEATVQNLNSEKTNLEEKVQSLTSENEKLKTQKITDTTSTSTPQTTSASSNNNSSQTSNSYTVYITNTGSKYHRDGCSYLKSKNAIDKNSAIAQGYTACSRCNP